MITEPGAVLRNTKATRARLDKLSPRETQVLEITVSNGTTHADEFTLEWYLFMQPEQNAWTAERYKTDQEFDKILKDQKNSKFFDLVYQAKQRMKP